MSETHYYQQRLRTIYKCVVASWASLVAQSIKNPPAMQEIVCSTGDLGSIPGSGSSSGGNANSLQYSCLENPMDREARWTIESMGLQRVRCDLVMCVDLSLGILFCSIDLYVCLCASTILF